LGHAVAFARGLATGTVSNVASRLCDKAATGQSPRVLMKVENVVKVEPVDEFELKGIRRPLAAYNVLANAPPAGHEGCKRAVRAVGYALGDLGMATVLIVEDQTHILALAQSLLEEEGYETLSATTADGAFAVLAKAKALDILLVDIILSGDMQAGIELAKHAVEMNPGLKMIYSTALTLTDRTKELLLPGSVILEKPYTIDELLTSLSEPRVRV
jgi:CheY-like chemotaxis protein